jgi:serine/threonine protein kinase
MIPISIRLRCLSRDDWKTYRETAACYEAAWSESLEPPAIDDFLAAPGHQPLRSLLLIYLIKEDYERRRDQDEAVAMARYFDRFPELRDDPLAIEELRSWETQLAGSPTQSTEATLPPSLPDGYRLLKELARGGMSRLFLIEDASGVRKVLKQIDPARRGNATDISRFANEITLARNLSAKGVAVVPASLVHEDDPQLAYMMPYCAGGSLRDRLRARGDQPLEPAEAARLVVALARTVQKLQEEEPPIIHRDLKPENVLFLAEDSDWAEPLIADLGLAKVLGQEGPTRSDAALGTWVYYYSVRICISRFKR